MACTTILVGKKASYDGSTLVARNDDSPSGIFHVKKMSVVHPKDQKNPYVSTLSYVKIELPDNPLRYTLMPNVDKSEGIWGAAGINSENVSMSATETITTNPRVQGADPFVKYVPSKKGVKETVGGIGEEDLVVLVLPYIHSAREGVLRLGSLLEKYGTYEPNGIAFSDKDEIWWLESIGGHHWIAVKVPDDRYVVMPNQFGLDHFDLEDAFGAKKENLCSSDLREFIKENHLDLNLDGKFNPRLAFGSHDDSDHTYNTPRAWFMLRYFNPRTYKWDGMDADYTPLSDDLPWSMVPERKITVEDVKYILSSHYQGTEYDPYGRFNDSDKKGAYRPIGISRTAFMSCAQIRGYLPKEVQAVEWVCFGSNAFNAFVPLYANVEKVPSYFADTTMRVDSNTFYWASRLLGALADAHFNVCNIHIERYQNALFNKGHQFLNENDSLSSSEELEKANEKMAITAKEETDKALNNVLFEASCHMKNGYSRSDN
jgi:dipeptidase